jgi:uncharacterized membrane protein
MNQRDLLPVALLVCMAALSLPVLFGLPWSTTIVLLVLYVLTLTAFGFVHGSQTLGVKGILVFFCFSAATTYAMEWLGTHFGIPFGHYYYTEQMGPLLMEVPVIIPLQWFNMMYVSYIAADVILSRWRRGDTSRPFAQVLPRMASVSLLVGLLMVSWDFINDPYMVAVGMWVWTHPSEFFGLVLFGVPLSNFLGWVLSSAVAVFLFEVYAHRAGFDSQIVRDTKLGPSVLLVLVPYLYALFYQAASGLLTGVFSLASADGWGPIGLATASMGLAAALTVWKRDL